MNYRGSVLWAAFALGTTVASAQQYLTRYDVTLDVGQPVTNILMLEESENSRSTTWPFQADGGGTTRLDNPFPNDEPVMHSLLVGIVQGLDTDENPDQKHVVLMMDPTAADLSLNIAWGTLFRNTLEEQLLADIELATSDQDIEVIEPGLDGIDAFAQGDAKDGILGPGGIAHSAWFQTGGDFSVLTFSDGQQIGTGQSYVVPVPAPEPASFAAIGIGLAAFLRKRRSKATSTP